MKPKMKLILAVDENWNIGLDGQMLAHISQDLRRFRSLTLGNIILMGRATFEALPGPKGLGGRDNIVLTRSRDFQADSVILAHSIDQALELIESLRKDSPKEVFLTGGGNLARQLLGFCDYAYITKIHKAFEDHDTSMVNLDQEDGWKLVKESECHREGELYYSYLDYKYDENSKV